ncbi:translocation protein TolB [Cohnella cellulosilytica]|uniref:Translocation protein TolB n=1 Tax=Cohnella cellulosilytica TaxID=986710 RepID=A0ABW2FAC9_9BACL
MLLRVWKLQGLTLVLSLLLFGSSALAAPVSKDTLNAAFVRDGNLWIKSGYGEERQLTREGKALRPKWSFDGEWIAYLEGENQPELKLWNVPTGRSRTVNAGGVELYQWSPERNELAYTANGKLYAVRAESSEAPKEIADGIGSFSWMPDGKRFIASSAARLLSEGWERVRILEISPEGATKTLFTLPPASDDFFVVGASAFKYSPSGKWIAFLATPTASLSADANYLCLLSSDGTSFHAVDQMLNRPDWIQWSGREDTLAYIAGVGREAARDKVLKTLRIPASGKPISHTPKGFVDQGLTWEGADRIVASRAKEYAGEGGSKSWPLPKLVEIRLQGGRSRSVTEPPRDYGDFAPQFFPREQRLVWVRSDRERADALMAGRGGKGPSVWIKQIDRATDYYGYGDWAEVLAVHG